MVEEAAAAAEEGGKGCYRGPGRGMGRVRVRRRSRKLEGCGERPGQCGDRTRSMNRRT